MNPQYQLYLQSEHWANLRLQAFKNAGFECEYCGAKRRLQGHHLIYRNPLESNIPEDIMCLCEWCHGIVHDFGYTQCSRDDVVTLLMAWNEAERTFEYLEATGKERIEMEDSRDFIRFCFREHFTNPV